MSQVADINNVLSEIAGGAHEQATGLVQVNTAITQMDQVTQQNAAMVEEATAASHSLSHETAQLSGLIGQFKVGQATSSEPLRRELQKAMPHAFRQSAKVSAGSKPRVAAAINLRSESTSRPVHGTRKDVANGAAAADPGDWQEF